MLPVVHVSGSPYDQGVAQGQQLKGRIHHNLAIYFDRFQQEVGLKRAQVLDSAEAFLAALPQLNPDYFEGMKGVAAGAEAELAAVAAINVRYEILYYQFGVQAMADGCTAFGLLPEATESGHLLLGQNWDWIPQIQGAVVHSIEPDGFEVVGFTEAGIFGRKIGMNSAGVGLCVNGLTSTDDNWDQIQKPFHVRCYEVLLSKSYDEAVAAVGDGRRMCAANFMIAQAPDRLVNLEAAPQAVGELTPERGRLAHANHFLAPEDIGVIEPPREKRPYSEARQNRMHELLHAKRTFSEADLETALKDHQGYPYSICRRQDPKVAPHDNYLTVTSVIMDLHARRMRLTDGPPDQNSYQTVSLGARTAA